MKAALRAFGLFWYEFIIGEDWKIAAAVAAVLVVGAVVVLIGAGGSSVFAPLLAVGLAGAFLLAFWIDLRSHR